MIHPLCSCTLCSPPLFTQLHSLLFSTTLVFSTLDTTLFSTVLPSIFYYILCFAPQYSTLHTAQLLKLSTFLHFTLCSTLSCAPLNKYIALCSTLHSAARCAVYLVYAGCMVIEDACRLAPDPSQ